jgi:PAS domain-containing protein
MYTVLVILVATGLSSTVGFQRIGNLLVGKVGDGEALHAHGRLSATLDEQQRLLLIMLERPLTAEERDALERTVETFDSELATAAGQVRAKAYGIEALSEAWSTHRAGLRKILDAPGAPPPALLAGALTSLGALRRTTTSFVLRRKLDASELRNLIRQTARRYVLLAVGLTSLGMVVALLFHFRFTHFVRRPLEQMTAFLRTRGTIEGAVGERLSVKGDETVIELMRVCNEHFENLERKGEQHWRELRGERRIANGLIEAVPGPAVLLNPAGEPLRANGAARELLASERGPEIRKEIRRVVVDEAPVDESSLIADVQAIVAPGQFSGSLVRLNPEPTPRIPTEPEQSQG